MRRLLPVVFAVALQVPAQDMPKASYPLAPKTDQADNYHGTRIADPYRNLESADNPSTQKWVGEENQLTAAYLAKIPGRDAIKQELTGLWDYEKITGLIKAGGNYFYNHNTGLQNQPVVFTRHR